MCHFVHAFFDRFFFRPSICACGAKKKTWQTGLAGYQARLWPLLRCKDVYAQQNRGGGLKQEIVVACYVYNIKNMSVAASSACLRALFIFFA